MGVYWAIAVRSFRRFSTYRIATAVRRLHQYGLRLHLLRRLPDPVGSGPGLGGYDVADALTFVWLQQGLLMPIGIFGASTTTELGERVRTGEIAVDLYRPAHLMLWWLSVDLGPGRVPVARPRRRPAAGRCARLRPALPVVASHWLAVAAALLFGLLVSFGIRYLVALSGFWIIDSRGMEYLAMVLSLFFSGTILPLVVFPGWLGEFARATPWAATLQVPIDVWLGRNPGGPAPRWCSSSAGSLVLLLAGQLLTRASRPARW